MENKQPMSKAKKEMIAWIIWIIAGVMFIAGGAVMMSIKKGTGFIIGGAIMAACGVAILIISIYSLIKDKKKAH